MSSATSTIVNAMSVDVEDYFQVSAFERHIARSAWDSLPCRVERNTERALGMFAEHDVHATFFVLGWVADRYPALVRRIVAGGHELASHGYSHTRVTQLSREEFRDEVRRTKALLEDLGGVEVRGYRAPSYSINRDNFWALDELAAAGYSYSSSTYPIVHDLYGIPDSPRFAYRPLASTFLEVPITTLRRFGKNYPCGGGGYFRLFPYALSRWAIRQVNRGDGQAAVFYFHPWEIDPDQPRQRNIGARTRFRHYLNLQRMESRLHRLCRDFRWGRMDEVFTGPALAAGAGEQAHAA